MGFYCPSNTSATPSPCPRGTYGDQTGLRSSDDCKRCDPGYFCQSLNATSTTGEVIANDEKREKRFLVNLFLFPGLCQAGYYCRNASISPDPPSPNPCDGCDAGPCPPGHYCDNGLCTFCFVTKLPILMILNACDSV